MSSVDPVEAMNGTYRGNGGGKSDIGNNPISRASRKVKSVIDSTSDNISHAAEVATTQVRSKPFQSSLIALGIGFIVGRLLKR